MKQLERLLHTGAMTLTGHTVGENLAGVTVADEEIIRPVGRALARRPTIVLIRGSLAPGGGIVKLAVADDRSLRFTGPAAVYDTPAQALDAVRRGEVTAGEVVVLRGQGPTGSPGMGMASQLVFALDGAGLTGQVAVVTDGQLSGLVNKGIVVGEVSPEAAAGGPLALVRRGDRIRIDVLARTADLDVPDAELDRRRAGLAGAARRDRAAGEGLAADLPAAGPAAAGGSRAHRAGRGGGHVSELEGRPLRPSRPRQRVTFCDTTGTESYHNGPPGFRQARTKQVRAGGNTCPVPELRPDGVTGMATSITVPVSGLVTCSRPISGARATRVISHA